MQQDVARGMLLMIAGAALLAVSDAIGKMLVTHYSALQILFLRNLIALPFATLVALRMGGCKALRTRRLLAHLLRAVFWVLTASLFLTSLRRVQLAEATAMLFVGPIFITMLSALLFRDPVGPYRWIAVLVGFAGALIMIRPGAAAFDVHALMPLGSALFYALLMLSARWIDGRDSVWTLLFYLTACSAVVSGAVMPFVWTEIHGAHFWHFLGVSLCSTAGMILMSQAFRLAPPPVIAPLQYLSILWSTGFGWLFWSEVPDGISVLGAAIIIGSGLFILWRERRRAQAGANLRD